MSRNEVMSVGLVKEFCECTEYLGADGVSDNDKTPSWDGYILFYRNKKSTITGQEQKIPIQVKGKDFSGSLAFLQKEFLSFQVETKHLQNYYSDGGVLYIVVAFGEQSELKKRMFAKILFPIDIKRILKNRLHQKSVTINLDHIETPKRLVGLCRLFVENRPRQFLLLQNPQSGFLPMEGFSVSTLKNPQYANPLVAAIRSNAAYFYSKQNGISVPLDIFDLTVQEDEEWHVDCGPDFSETVKMERVYSKDTTEIVIGGTIHVQINVETKKGTCEIKTYDTQSFFEAYQIARLLTCFCQSRRAVIDRVHDFSSFFESIVAPITEEFMSNVSSVLWAGNALKSMGVDINLLTLGEVKAMRNLAFWKTALVEKKPISINDDRDSLVYYQAIGDKFLLILGKRCGDNLYKVSDALQGEGEELQVSYLNGRNERIVVSKWFLLEPEKLPSMLIDRAQMINELRQVTNDDEKSTINNLALSMIAAYDREKRVADLIFAQELIELADTSAIETINRLQIKVRLQTLTDDDKREIAALKLDEDKVIVCCACIILAQKDEFWALYNTLSEVQKETFRTWPIFTLAKAWGMSNELALPSKV